KTCSALVPLAGDVRDGLLYGLATAGLGFLHLGRAWRYTCSNQTVRRICRMTICKHRWGFLARPRSLLIGWLLGPLLAIGMLGLLRVCEHCAGLLSADGAGMPAVDETEEFLRQALLGLDPALKALVLVLLGLPVLQTIIALTTWQTVALSAARLPAARAQLAGMVAGICMTVLIGFVVCYAVWPGPMSNFDDRWLLVALVPLLVAGGWWVQLWRDVQETLQRESRSEGGAA
ncbi:MAG: hypothetical protein ACF8NJ_10930, partial [Phycisphaerales bacterium JB038]